MDEGATQSEVLQSLAASRRFDGHARKAAGITPGEPRRSPRRRGEPTARKAQRVVAVSRGRNSSTAGKASEALHPKGGATDRPEPQRRRTKARTVPRSNDRGKW